MSKFLAYVFILSSSIGITYYMMVEAWGLEVKSWPVLIFGWIMVFVLQGLLATLRNE